MSEVTEHVIAYHGDHDLKDNLLAELALHREADQLVKGSYGAGQGRFFRGCAVGCSINSLNERQDLGLHPTNHAGLASAVGMTEDMAMLEDTIFEHLPYKEAVYWPERLMSAMQPGADMSLVHVDLLILIQKRNLSRVASNKKLKEGIHDVLGVLTKWRHGCMNREEARLTAENVSFLAFSPDTPPKEQPLISSAENAARSASMTGGTIGSINTKQSVIQSTRRVFHNEHHDNEWRWVGNTLIEIVTGA